MDISAPARTEAGFRSASHYQYRPLENPTVSEQSSEIFSASQADFFTSGITQDIRSFFHIGESFFATGTNDGLLIIDQHAAHERILYEKFLKKTSVESEALFLPLRIELPVGEHHIIIRNRELLEGFGLDIDDFAGNNVIVRSLPRELDKADIKGLLIDIAAGIIEEETSGIKGDMTGESLLKNIAARLACHKSVRGSEKLTNDELIKMMSDLDKTGEPDKCPHGTADKDIAVA